jgi:hypothetical protein
MKTTLLSIILFFAFAAAHGQKLPFQGKLIESGTPVDGTRTFEFEIAAAEWSETHTDVPITDGLYFVVLGSINPLPDSLFYGVDEQSLSITVDGTALSPVVLFKPLSTPFEGSEITVQNNEGTVVGSLKARTDELKHGEFMLKGEDTGTFDLGFYQAEGDSDTDMPFFSMHKNDTTYSYMSAFKWNNRTSGRIYLGAGDGDYANIYPNYFNGRHNNRSLFAIGHANWSGAENFGLVLLDGPNSRNFELTGQHWNQKPDLPFFKMRGSTNQDVVVLSAEDNAEESGNIRLNTKRDENQFYKELNANSTGLRFWAKQNWDVLHESASLISENRDGFGDAGYFNLNGPNSANVSIGTRHWEETPDLPLINLFGENNFHGMELSITRDGENNQFGWINLMSENGKNLYLSPEGFGLQGVSMSTIVNQSGNFGSLFLDGPNSRNITLMPEWWDKPDMGFFEVSGTNQGRVNIEVNDDGNGQYGLMHLYSDYQKSIRMEPTSIALRDDDNGYIPLVFISTNNDSGNGWAGNLTLNGPSSNNIQMGSNWGNSNLPWMALHGQRVDLVHIAGFTEGPDSEIGYVHLMAEDGSSSNLNPRRIETLSNAGQSGWLDAYQVKFNDNGQEMTYNAYGISGSGPLSIQNGVNINGDVVVNGVTEHSSDRRFKKNIQKVGYSLQKIEFIEGVSYDWRQDEFPERNFSSDKQIGLIAQDLEAQFPELVKTNADGYKSVNYNGFTAVLLEAVKELNAKVEKLEVENSLLKAELSASATNKTEIEMLKEQMENLVQMVQAEQSSAALEIKTTTPGLK